MMKVVWLFAPKGNLIFFSWKTRVQPEGKAQIKLNLHICHSHIAVTPTSGFLTQKGQIYLLHFCKKRPYTSMITP